VIDSSNCLDQRMTLQLNGPLVTYLGLEDLHEASYDATEVEYAFASTSGCDYQVGLYPSSSTFSNSSDDVLPRPSQIRRRAAVYTARLDALFQSQLQHGPPQPPYGPPQPVYLPQQQAYAPPYLLPQQGYVLTQQSFLVPVLAPQLVFAPPQSHYYQQPPASYIQQPAAPQGPTHAPFPAQ
jgi:hypothetical protein